MRLRWGLVGFGGIAAGLALGQSQCWGDSRCVCGGVWRVLAGLPQGLTLNSKPRGSHRCYTCAHSFQGWSPRLRSSEHAQFCLYVRQSWRCWQRFSNRSVQPGLSVESTAQQLNCSIVTHDLPSNLLPAACWCFASVSYYPAGPARRLSRSCCCCRRMPPTLLRSCGAGWATAAASPMSCGQRLTSRCWWWMLSSCRCRWACVGSSHPDTPRQHEPSLFFRLSCDHYSTSTDFRAGGVRLYARAQGWWWMLSSCRCRWAGF